MKKFRYGFYNWRLLSSKDYYLYFFRKDRTRILDIQPPSICWGVKFPPTKKKPAPSQNLTY